MPSQPSRPRTRSASNCRKTARTASFMPARSVRGPFSSSSGTVVPLTTLSSSSTSARWHPRRAQPKQGQGAVHDDRRELWPGSGRPPPRRRHERRRPPSTAKRARARTPRADPQAASSLQRHPVTPKHRSPSITGPPRGLRACARSRPELPRKNACASPPLVVQISPA